MSKNQKQNPSDRLFIELVEKKFEAVMQEVHKQVKVYEERERKGQLTPPPHSNPLFSE